jgi:hypothetical protein
MDTNSLECIWSDLSSGVPSSDSLLYSALGEGYAWQECIIKAVEDTDSAQTSM